MRKAELIVILIFISNLLLGQSMLIQKADTAFKKKNYYDSAILYQKALEKGTSDSTITQYIDFKIAECFDFSNDYEKAKIWYEKSIGNGYTNPVAYYNYANMLSMSGEYNEAKMYFKKYLNKVPDDKNAQLKIKSCEFALGTQKEKVLYSVNNKEELNSEYSDFSVAYVQNRIIFASSRFDKNDKKYYSWTGQNFSNFYESKYNTGALKWKQPLKSKGGINSRFNDGTLCYDKKTKIAYFMQCNGLKGKKANCNIYCSSFDEKEDEWNEPEIFVYNSNEYSIGHPAITSDARTMYFVSDMPDGFGGKDIWIIKKNNNQWSAPVNLGDKINTQGDEMFPYILRDTLLYFSSDGHIGFGGLDLFYSKIENDSFSEPKNLKQPFNSSADDFGIMFLEQDSGLFCSNRYGGKGDDDIYSFNLIPIHINASGLVTDRDSKEPIGEAIVTLTGNNGSIDSTLSDLTGYYLFESLKQDIDYVVSVRKQGYLGDSKSFSTTGIRNNKNFSKKSGYDLDLQLNLNFALIKIVKEEIKIHNIYYDYGKWDLRDTSKIELDKLVNILNENPKIKILINSHTDERSGDEFNLELSKNRAQAVVNYLIKKNIEPNRLASKGWGESKLLTANAKTEEEHQLNRRTSFNIVNVDELDSKYNPVKYKDIKSMHRDMEKALNKEIKKGSSVQDKVITGDISFRVQIFASKKILKQDKYKKVEENISEFKVEYKKYEDGYYRYTIGLFDKYESAAEMEERLKKLGFDSFVTAFKQGKKISVYKAKRLLENEKE